MPEDLAAAVSGQPEHTSESEEMYLLTLALAEEEGRSGPHPVSALAGALGVSVASTHEMIRKLVGRGLVAYEPYRGVDLTGRGRAVAVRVLRTRRLWSTFLADHLEFSPQEADALACQLEHVTPADAAERLAAYLGDPAAGPLGRAIPPADARTAPAASIPLNEAPLGGQIEVVAVAAGDEASSFLAAQGLAAGARIEVEARGRSGLLLGTAAGPVHLAVDLAREIRVREVPGG